MDLEVIFIFAMTCLISFCQSQSRVRVHYITPYQEHRRIYMIPRGEWSGTVTHPYPPSGIPIKAVLYPLKYYSTIDYSAIADRMKVPLLNSLEARMPRFKTEIPPLGYSSVHSPYNYNLNTHGIEDANYQFIAPKEIYFEDYPHLKALFHYQKVRTNNYLSPYKMGSLRINSPYYRP